ncbi:hypothetical protein PAXRUDRAFT_21325 [Paxillus rubicundulus Ve08.2h10]|uniref:Unplaced genomic scaffold scaffold_5373, whole genome shotgun sequence n=1 Tax=Paxillus rubicundulus Ve08.2h10 TaxID=930991 RepID=A0A0D0CC13_9AGAM|nr:hypothetical protein PAXRUDRAFT_21325 [Paxillus rubicundulus Ve08.2h10]
MSTKSYQSWFKMEAKSNATGWVRFDDNTMEINPPSSLDHFLPPSIPSQISSWDFSTPQGSTGELPDSPEFQPPPVPTDLIANLPEDLRSIRFPTPSVISASLDFPTPPLLPEDGMLSFPSPLQSPLASQTPIIPFLGAELPPPPPVPSSSLGHIPTWGSLSQERLQSILRTLSDQPPTTEGDFSAEESAHLEYYQQKYRTYHLFEEVQNRITPISLHRDQFLLMAYVHYVDRFLGLSDQNLELALQMQRMDETIHHIDEALAKLRR